MIVKAANWAQDKFELLALPLAFLAPLLLRAYLAPLFWKAGMAKYNSFESTVAWFGNSQWGLGLPFPELNAALATGAEVGGAILLVLGLATRWICLPLMVTMIVAAVTVHMKNGWQFVHDKMSAFPSENLGEAMERLAKAKDILKEHGDYGWLTEHGKLVMSNSGIELVAAYFVMLLALMYLGGGSYLSLDYWIAKRFRSKEA